MSNGLLLGCIADDFTGATDLCNTLVKQGMTAVQIIGVPAADMTIPDADAIVIALKSRSCPAADAIAFSTAALKWLQSAGVRQFFFKYCSTFDSTDDGNIGPVADALLDALDSDFTIACPAFPETGRTIYKGHLFVGDVLLSDSPMRNHPLNPMTDANLVKVLRRQTPHDVGLVPHETVREGPDAIESAFVKLRSDGVRYAVTDAIDDNHLLDIGNACGSMRLITGGSGIALGLPENFRRQGLLGARGAADGLPRIDGLSAVIAGSCSDATLGQIEEMRRHRPAFEVDPLRLERSGAVVEEALRWSDTQLAEGPVLFFSSATPAAVAKAQRALGRERAGELVEQTLAGIAAGLVERGVRRLVVAGGETSGAVVQALGVRALRVGSQIDPGVPWTASLGETPLALALKSGNFGGRDFFLRAFSRLP